MEVFHEFILVGPFNEVQSVNMSCIEFTPERLGISVADIFKELHPLKADSILVQATLPHCFTSTSRLRSVPLLIIIRRKLAGAILSSMVVPEGKP